MAAKVLFDEDRCKGCELCTTACPLKLVVLDTKRINARGYHPATVYDQERCTGCASCAKICPDVAIRVEK
jgi:2-oxoglutarate ferredoxin oxidoreductase subunit delta